MNLATRSCVPCRENMPPLSLEQMRPLAQELKGWKVIESHHLEKTYTFPDFQGALGFTNRVGNIAEIEKHHPEIHLGWGMVRIEIWTHRINGLTESDFILAAKIDAR